ncbi:alpha/beta hydrolase [Acinetobacter sp. ANC 4558]|uniref:alpha/beta fold hydrolase n=1 Tax=Acinetobacter sp. ANC 4558 TaxID=1977876 RepID=UPI000A335241|nr:alpha/beta fold hydrolase [Acinetobacter sp. ANC 4558]OTG79561.1 alpha/beta hydrolase [Acinetobacter sp. ANC 4558]
MILHYEYHEINQTTPIVFIHGLFGSLSNLGMLARAFTESHSTLQIDVRNHGKSAHSSEMNYELMAQDILDTIDSLNIKNFIVIGHSMGGKIAMKLSEISHNRLEKLIILDMSPFEYLDSHHTHIFKALFAVQHAHIETRSQAISIMKDYIQEDTVIQFLLKSFYKGKWLFNVEAIYQNYSKILSWNKIFTNTATLFIRGGYSPYISTDAHIDSIAAQFSNAELVTIDQAGHWLHAEKTTEVVLKIKEFIK